MIREIELLNAEDCVGIVSEVHKLQSCWIQREKLLPFYTFAVASYLDAVTDAEEQYYSRAGQTNPFLWDQLHWMYERVLKAFSETYQGPVKYAEKFALPGFHIFQGHQFFRKEVASVHFDLQYQLLEWGQTLKQLIPISFTLPVLLPKEGAGLWHWELTYDEVDGKTQEEKDQLISSRKKSYYCYKEGTMMIHSGHELHQIAGIPNFQPDEERITLQGHGLFVDGTLYLYW